MSLSSSAKAAAKAIQEEKGRGEALAPAEAKPSAIAASDRPLIALDWHKTISHERFGRRGDSFVPAGNITVLRRLQELGYDLCVTSFSSAQETQQRILREATELQALLLRPFHLIAILPQKSLGDHSTGKVSITGHRGTKAHAGQRFGLLSVH